MGAGVIEIGESSVFVREVEIAGWDVSAYLKNVPEEERTIAFVHAVEVGTYCLERAGTAQDMQFVRRQVEMLLASVERTVGAIPEATERELVSRLGTGEGQVLAPLHRLVEEVGRGTAERLGEVRRMLATELDPSQEVSTLGRALRNLRELLDPARRDSIQAGVEAALGRITAAEGPLLETVRSVVATAVRPLADEVDRLGREIRGAAAAEEALLNTTTKGLTYENDVVARLQACLGPFGITVMHVGPDNRPGDIVLGPAGDGLAGEEFTIVVEVRDRQCAMGRRAIAQTMEAVMAERNATAGIYLSREANGLAREVGDWAEGSCSYGSWVAVTDTHLLTAIRFLIVIHRLQALRASQPEVDTAVIEGQVKRMRTALGRVTTISRKLTEMRGCADDIQTEAEDLRNDIRSSLTTIEDAMRAAPAGACAAAAAAA